MPALTTSGKTLVEYLNSIADAAGITEGDMIFAAGRQAERIVERTLTGVDFHNQSFAPYSTRGPYYFSPGGSSRKTRQAAALHHARYYGGGRKRGGTSVKYGSYADYKAAHGASVVDLGGLEGSILSNIVVSSEGSHHTIESAASLNINAYPSRMTQAAVGIYDEPGATRAEGHNLGVPSRHLPQREFLGMSDTDEEMILDDITDRVIERISRAME